MRAVILVATILALAAPSFALAQPAPSHDAGPCTAGTVRLVAYHYVVDGVEHDALDGRVGPGDLFRLVVTLQACGSPSQDVMMEFEVPPCEATQPNQRLNGVEDLNSANVADDAEALMVKDLRAALACDPVLPQGLASAAIISGTLGAIGTLVAMSALRRRPG